MRKMKKFNLWASILGILLVILAYSCKKDEEEPIDNTPVLGQNFNYTVEANKVTFTTTLTGNVWWTCSGTDYPAVDQTAVVAFAEAGTYTFTCSLLEAGVTLTSSPFDVVVEVGDTTIYNTEYWIDLTGGYNKSKTWVLDVEAKVLPGPLSFMGTSWDFVAEENVGEDAWLWDADLGFTFENDSDNVRMDWPGEEGYGSMTFDLIGGKNFTADKKKEPAETGTYELDWETRTITITGGTILRSYKPFAQVKDDPNCEGEDCPKHMEDGIDGISDWNNYKIYDLTDTLLRLAVSRDQDVHDEGVCWLIYNFVETNIYESIIIEEPVEIEWPDGPTAVETNVTAESDKLTGTWGPDTTVGWNAWYPGFWNFETSTNDLPAEYVGEGDADWDPYFPSENDTWAMPNDSILDRTMTFGADLSLVIKEDDTEIYSGTFKTDGNKITTEGVNLIIADDKIIDPSTSLLVEIKTDTLRCAFYRQASDTKKEWVRLTYTKK